MASGTIRKVSEVTTKVVSTSQSKTISTGSYASITIDATLSGYTPIGVVGSSMNAGVGCAITESTISGNSVRLIVTNLSSASRTLQSVSARILYER
jgi:hypothetical protein